MGQLAQAGGAVQAPEMGRQMAQAAAASEQGPADPNIGLVDVTTPEGAANPNNMAPNDSAAGKVADAKVATDRGAGLNGPEEQATPEEQESYETAMSGLNQILYEDEERSNAILGMIQPEDKVGSLVKTGVMLIKQLDEGIDLEEGVIAQVTMDTGDLLIELAETGHNIEYSDKEAQAIAGSLWEGVMALFGTEEADPAQLEEMTQGMSPEDLQGYEEQYKGFLGG